MTKSHIFIPIFQMEEFRQVIEREMCLVAQQDPQLTGGIERLATASVRVDAILKWLENGMVKQFEHQTTIPQDDINKRVVELLPKSSTS